VEAVVEMALTADFDPEALLEMKTRELALLQSELRRLKQAVEEAAVKPAQVHASSVREHAPSQETRPMPTDPSTVSKEKKLKEFLSEETLSKLKAIFQHYASIQTLTLVDKMELAQYRRFIKDAQLVPQICTRAQGDLFFFHKNTGKNVTFWRWVQILTEFAKLKYQVAIGTEVLERLVTEEIATKAAIRESELAVLGWEEAVEDPTVQQELRKGTGMMDLLFSTFCSLKTGSFGFLPLAEYIHLASESHIVPELLTKRDSVKVFRAVQSEAFSDVLTREEFQAALVCTAMQAYPDKDSSTAVAMLFQWLERSAQPLRTLMLRRGRAK
jgi:hypothetical protein